jgi:16S rRNA (cytidine1402-2'-O)-methyltransferase
LTERKIMNPDSRSRTYTIDGHVFHAQAIVPGLHLVATPLGNLADVSLRCLSVLAAADVVLCEDTRVTTRLMQRYSIETGLKPYHDHNAASVRPAILQRLKGGAAIALVSDAGMPMVNDPGYKLVRDCVVEAIAVDVIPGPTSPVTALALSGLPSDRFMFAGFLPAKVNARLRTLRELSAIPATILLFESAGRIDASLQDIGEVLGGRPVAVAREMTKLHQEVLRGTAKQIIEQLAIRAPLKGEITIVIGPPDAALEVSEDQIPERLANLLREHPVSKAASILARETGKPKAEIYDLAISFKSADS